jgi:hypothetical protein
VSVQTCACRLFVGFCIQIDLIANGKANQYFLRGFNLDHGTDFANTRRGRILPTKAISPRPAPRMASSAS